jgi:hypothetical protein
MAGRFVGRTHFREDDSSEMVKAFADNARKMLIPRR